METKLTEQEEFQSRVTALNCALVHGNEKSDEQIVERAEKFAAFLRGPIKVEGAPV